MKMLDLDKAYHLETRREYLEEVSLPVEDMDLRDEVVWSAEAYSLAELKRSRFEYPLLVKADYGLYQSLEDNTISVDQLMLLHKWEESERVIAKNKKGLQITIPMDHKHKFEVYQTNRTPSKVGLFSLQNVVRSFKPPVLARFDPYKTAEFYIHEKLYSSREFGLFELNAVHYLNYVKASAIDDEGKINKEYVSIIPMHLSIEFFVGKSMRHFAKDYYNGMVKQMSLCTERLVYEATHIYTFSGILEYDDVMEDDYIEIPGYPTWGRNKGRTLKLPLPQVPTDPPRFINRTVCIVKPEFRLELPWETATRKQTLPTTNQPITHTSNSNPHTSSSYETMTDPNHTNKARHSYLLPSSTAYNNLPNVAHESDSASIVPIGQSDQSQTQYYNDHMMVRPPGHSKQTKDDDYYNTAQMLENSDDVDPPIANLPNVVQEDNSQSQTKCYNNSTKVTPSLQNTQTKYGDYYNITQTTQKSQFEDHPPSDQGAAGTVGSMATAACDYSNLWRKQPMVAHISTDHYSSDSSSDYDDTALRREDIGLTCNALSSGLNTETLTVISTLFPPPRSSKSTLPPRDVQPLHVSRDQNTPHQSQYWQMAVASSSNKVSGGFNSPHGRSSEQLSLHQCGLNHKSTYKTQIIHSPSQIPDDISIMGIMEISDCLHHLKLGRFIDKFIEFRMDGKLLQQFNEEELMGEFGEFGMGSVAATTVVLFAKGAMRL